MMRKFKNKNLKLKIYVLTILMAFCSVSYADSIWNKESSSPYSTDKAYKDGDIINIIILESSQAQHKAGTDTNIKDDLGMKFTHSIRQLTPIIGANNQAAGQLYNRYKGMGGTSRTSNVQARIAAWVTDVLENGNLVIKGNHKVEVNSEIQKITITGMIRPKDISGSNSIYSYQVASAELSVIGTGVVAEAESPGWITRILNWLF